MKMTIIILLISGFVTQEINAQNTDNQTSSIRHQLLPVDEAWKEPSFLQFRQRLLEAVLNHDTDFIISILDSHMINSFGGNDGIPEFRSKWHLDSPETSPLWMELERTLNRGGMFTDATYTTFIAPYVSLAWPDGVGLTELGDFDYVSVATIDPEVSVYQQPDSTAQLITELSYEIVKFDVFTHPDRPGIRFTGTGPGIPDGWCRIDLLDGRLGYVKWDQLSYSLYLAVFKKRQGRWIMTQLTVGE